MKTELSKIVQDLKQGIITDKEARKHLLGLLGVGGSVFIDVKKVQEQFSIECKKYIESKPYQDMIKALKRAGAF